VLQFRAETGLLFSRMSKLQPSPEVLRSIDARSLAAGTALGALLTLAAGGCLSAHTDKEESSSVVLSSGSSGDETGGDTSTLGGIMTTTEDPDRTSGDSTSVEPGTDTAVSGSETGQTTGSTASCGDGVRQADEGCDDGPDNADDGACTTQCQPATCGDGKVHAGVEACDDGTNDGSYGGCASDCSALAAHCGDGVKQGPEQCDDGLAVNGCLPDTCTLAKSCKQLKMAYPQTGDGLYTIAPLGIPRKVLCDMDADGGGYTFLKVASGVALDAKGAEKQCASYGMKLLVPRSPAHLAASAQVAQSDVLVPVGPGTTKASLDYLKIFGIYPKVFGESCVDKPLNHSACPQWTAEGGVFWVTGQAVSGEPGVKTCVECSLAYYWNPNGSLIGYESVGPNNESAKSDLFMCEVPDMLPLK